MDGLTHGPHKATRVTTRVAAYEFLVGATAAESDVRAQTIHARPMPITGHNIAFAQTEAGEVLDALLRAYPEYVRNNGKVPDLEMEIGDVFSQIASAMLTVEREKPTFHADIAQYLVAKLMAALTSAQIMWQVGSAIQASRDLQEAASWTLELCHHLGVDPNDALARSHAKTLAKHALTEDA